MIHKTIEHARDGASPFWDARSLHRVPPGVAHALENAGFSSKTSHLCVLTGLLVNGQFGEAWLAVGPDRLGLLLREDGTARLTWHVPMSAIKQARTQPVTGGGMLVLDIDGQAHEIIRYDAGQAPLFSGISHCLNREIVRRDKPKESSGYSNSSMAQDFEALLARQRERYCSNCARPLPKNSTICQYCLKRASTLERVLKFAAPYRKYLVLMATLMVAGTILHLVPPQIMRILVDEVLLSPSQADRLPGLVVLLALVMVLQHGVGIVRARLGIWVGCHITNDIQYRAFRHLQAPSLSFFNKQQTGALMSRMNNDARQMQGFLVEGIQYTVVNLLTVIGVVSVLIWMNPLLGLLVLLPAPIVVLLSVWTWKRISRRFRLLWISLASASSYLNDALSGIRVIKSFGREEAEIERYGHKIGLTRDRMILAEQSWQTLVPILNLLIQSSLVLVWYFGAYEIYGNHLTIGGLLAYISYLGMMYGPLQLLTRLNDWLSRSLTAAARVFEILDLEADIRDRPGARRLKTIRGEIELRDVTFGYEKHQSVLKHVSFKVNPGEMIGLVGRSGAGKSTIINLIGRLYDVDEGEILLDGTDLRDWCIEDIRRHIGFVLQETFLFNGTVAENIAYARPNASHDEIIEAAVAANAHEFIMELPDSYDTVVGERGTRLSGGERQRIAIARALLHDPKILILDEATSSMDTETEAKIQQALKYLIKGRTTIAIAHRLSTLSQAQKVIVIEGGEIVELGTHAELMALDSGIYRKFVCIQTEWGCATGLSR
jgi:ABC-type multidrug transport system, ATPase and permease components